MILNISKIKRKVVVNQNKSIHFYISDRKITHRLGFSCESESLLNSTICSLKWLHKIIILFFYKFPTVLSSFSYPKENYRKISKFDILREYRRMNIISPRGLFPKCKCHPYNQNGMRVYCTSF